MADLGPARGFCAWYDKLTTEHDLVAAYLGSHSIDEVEELREQFLILNSTAVHGRVGDSERHALEDECSTVLRTLLGVLHSTAATARYLGCDRSMVIDRAFPNLKERGPAVLDAAEEALPDPAFWKNGKLRQRVFARSCGVSPMTALPIARALGYV
jgi:hypothetical protein